MNRRRPSMLLVLLGLGVIASGVVVFIGTHIATDRWLVAAIFALSVWTGLGALGLGLARVNDRLGYGLALQRRSAASLVTTLNSLSADAEAPPPPPPPPLPSDARARLGQLLALPKTTIPIQTERSRLVNGSVGDTASVMGELRPASAVRVAMIADEFTYRSFEPEWTTTRLNPSNWREAMEEAQPEVFFCESAWAGGTPPDRPWQGKIYDTVRRENDGRGVLIDIITHCRKEGIPTVFWNKEDPIHFGDRIHDFVVTANLFDAVFTTAAECVEGYVRDTDVEHVGVLPFAVQPRIFNPFGVAERSDSAVFAGSWYPNYSARADAAGKILDLVLASGRGLEIFDRMYDSPERHRFPEKYDAFRRPSIPYNETAQAYRSHNFSITLNTITDSKTMFARRIYEAAACGSVVLSNTSIGVEDVFGDAVILADRDPGRLLELTGDQYTRMQRNAVDIAMQNTYAHRADTVLQMVGVPHATVNGSATLAIQVSSMDEFAAATNAGNELGFDDVLYLVDGSAASTTHLRDTVSSQANARIVDLAAVGQIGDDCAPAVGESVFHGKLSDLPPKEWLRHARLLLPYSQIPLASNHGGASYARTPAEGTLGTLMTRADFTNHVCRGQALTSVHRV